MEIGQDHWQGERTGSSGVAQSRQCILSWASAGRSPVGGLCDPSSPSATSSSGVALSTLVPSGAGVASSSGSCFM